MAKKFDTSNKVDILGQNISQAETLNNKTKEFAGKYQLNTLVDIPLDMVSLGKNIRDDSIIDAEIQELANSILEKGQIEPIIVYYDESTNKYIIKVGHRRYKACYSVNLPTIKCVITESFKDEIDRIVTQAIENEHRLNMSPVERESYIRELLDLGLKQEEIAKKLNKNKGFISEALKAYSMRASLGSMMEDLTEEPSTRDMWKTSKLSQDAIERVIEKAVASGGTKENFKEAVNEEYNKNKEIDEKIENNTDNEEENDNSVFNIFNDLNVEDTLEDNPIPEYEKPVVFNISNKVSIKENEKIVTVQNILNSNDNELNTIVTSAIKEYYMNKGYNCD